MKIAVEGVLFRVLNSSNAKMFLRQQVGEHHLRFDILPAVAEFAAGLDVVESKANGTWSKRLPIQPMTGPNPVPAQDLTLRFWGTVGAKKNTYYIAGQSATPYALWKPGRARPGATSDADLIGDVAMVVKDVDGNYHARWVRREDIDRLPTPLAQRIRSSDKGVFMAPTTGARASEQVQEVIAALRRHHNVLLYGPPGTGKTHLVAEVREHFGAPGLSLDTDAESDALQEDAVGEVHVSWATFHQSYSYEDFLIGLRPEPNTGGGFRLVPRPGLLLEAAEWARQPGRESLLVIDEINRGNVSRIFGEFITLMEPDKRLDDAGDSTTQTVAVRLPFADANDQVEATLPDGTSALVPTPFTMPLRVYTLATMNSVDKSVAPLDAALRRRFHVLPLFPRLDAFRGRLNLDDRPLTRDVVPASPVTRDQVCWTAVALFAVLNKRISLFLGADFQLGEWFLAPLIGADTDDEARAVLADIWRTAVLPQLEDYFVGRSEQLEKTLGDPKNDEPALVIDVPEAAFEELGAVRSLRGNPVADDAAVLALMAAVARSGLQSPPVNPDQGLAGVGE